MPESSTRPNAASILPCLVLALPLALTPLTGCAQSTPGGVDGSPQAGNALEVHSVPAREPYTRCYEILNLGALIGYLVSYEALPSPEHPERSLPTGASRIQDLNFRDIGFLTRDQTLHRFDELGNAVRLGNFPRDEALRRFFDTFGRIELRPLSEAVAAERARTRS